VAAEHDAFGLRLGAHDLRDHPAQLPSGSDPRDPRHPVAVAVAHEPLAVGRGGERDDTVRVQVVDVGRVDEAVHRRVDRRGGATGSERAEREEADHLVLVLDAAVAPVEAEQPVEFEGGQPRVAQGAEVAAGSLDVQQCHALAGRRVHDVRLARGVAAAVVRHRGIGAEPVRPVEQGRHLRGDTSGTSSRVVPRITLPIPSRSRRPARRRCAEPAGGA
jgi:hypothetical protein